MAGQRRPRGSPDPFPVYRNGKVDRYAIDIELPTGGERAKRRIYGKTAAECRAKAEDFRAELAAGAPGKPDRQTLAEYLERWYSEAVDGVRAERTRLGYRTVLDVHILPALGRVRLDQLTAAQIQTFYAERRRAGKAPGTIRNIHTVLRGALAHAVRSRILAHNPAAHQALPKRPPSPAKALTATQAQALLDAARDSRLEALYVLVLTTGLREAEVFGLRWEDLDLARGRAHLRQTIDHKRRGNPVDTTKTHRSRRPVPLIPLTVTALRAHKERQDFERLVTKDWVESGLVFVSRRGTSIRASSFMNREWTQVLAKVGLTVEVEAPKRRSGVRLVRQLRFHDLRHSAATFLIAQKVPMKVVSAILGHSGVAITMDLYGHVHEEMLDEAATALSALFPGPETGD